MNLATMSDGMGTINSKTIETKIYVKLLEAIGMKCDPMTGLLYHPFNMSEPVKIGERPLRLDIGKAPGGVACDVFHPLWRFGHTEVLLMMTRIQYFANNGIETNGDDQVLNPDSLCPEDFLVMTTGGVDAEGNTLHVASVVQTIDNNVCIGQGCHVNKSHAGVFAVLDFIKDASFVGGGKLNKIIGDITLMDTLIDAEKVKPTKADATAERERRNDELIAQGQWNGAISRDTPTSITLTHNSDHQHMTVGKFQSTQQNSFNGGPTGVDMKRMKKSTRQLTSQEKLDKLNEQLGIGPQSVTPKNQYQMQGQNIGDHSSQFYGVQNRVPQAPNMMSQQYPQSRMNQTPPQYNNQGYNPWDEYR